MKADRFQLELQLAQQGKLKIAGVDEAGRGPLAGPVVAAAVIFPADWIKGGIPVDLAKLNDSKQLSAAQRDDFFARLTQSGDVIWAVAEINNEEIDQINILNATHRAMSAAIGKLTAHPDWILVDGRPVPALGLRQTAVVKGDSLSYSIAAASVIAKVTRDRQMAAWNDAYPQYGFAGHKGYGTADHLAAIAKHGPCPIHRRSFAPIKTPDPRLFA